jgi:NAD(P)-dependent dehydrogenase (short-subunit alcohol dehydrogenase family)
MNKTVLITGASSGFGKAIAQLFASRGWNVIATMRNTADAADLGDSSNVLVAELDVTVPTSIDRAIKSGIERFAKLDVLINNAGFGQYGMFEAVPQDKIQRNFDVNVFGVMNVMRAVIPIFRKQQEGTILNISSAGGLVGLPSISTYIATKFALEGFTESVSYELASQNIVVKMVEPGGGDTDFHSRAAKENVGAGGIPSYEAFIARTNAVMANIGARMATPERIAAVVYGAVTDGTKRLRYLAGDDVKQFVDARRKLSDEDYEAYMREQLI